MTTQELREYVNHARDLESAIFAHQKLISGYREFCNQQKPKKPALYNPPFSKSRPYCASKEKYGTQCFIYAGLFYLVSLLPASFLTMYLFYETGFFICLISILFLSCSSTYIAFHILNNVETQRDYDAKILQYQKELAEYTDQKKQWEIDSNQRQIEYDAAIIEYEIALKEYNRTYLYKLEKYNNTLETLSDTLKTYYSSNVIFEKYRNFTAIATISEYLQSGRCSTLEGADGAYNMYEMELRQNIVIGQLSAIISNLDQIKNNQYTLYQEIVHANQTVSEIMSEIKDMNSTAKQTAYFAGVNALIAAAPKISYGYMV